MILVAGGTGRLGRRVATRLLARGSPVRVLARRPDGVPAGAEACRGDVRSAADLRAALAGVTVVVSCVQGLVGRGVSPASVDRDGNLALIEAARETGADVVLMSVTDAAPDSPVELFRAKHDAETALAGSGVPWTVVRSAAFLETWVELLERSARPGRRPVLLGNGDVPTPWVPVDDVAAVVERAVVDPAQRGRILTVVGAEPCTLTELAQEVMRADGRPGVPRHVPRPAVVALANTVGRVVPSAGRVLRMSLLLADLEPVLGPDSRSGLGGLPATPLAVAVAAATGG